MRVHNMEVMRSIIEEKIYLMGSTTDSRLLESLLQTLPDYLIL